PERLRLVPRLAALRHRAARGLRARPGAHADLRDGPRQRARRHPVPEDARLREFLSAARCAATRAGRDLGGAAIFEDRQHASPYVSHAAISRRRAAPGAQASTDFGAIVSTKLTWLAATNDDSLPMTLPMRVGIVPRTPGAVGCVPAMNWQSGVFAAGERARCRLHHPL